MSTTQQSSLPETDGRRARGNRTREKLLEAAIELFGSRGFESTSMKDLAAAAGVRAPAIYNHFSSKEDVLVAASTWALHDFHSQVVSTDEPSLPTRVRLEGLVRRHVNYQLDNLKLAKSHDLLMDADSMQHLMPPEVHAQARTTMRKHLDLMTELISEVVPAEANPPARLSALAVLSMIDRVLTWYRPDGQYHKSEIAGYYWILVQRMLGANETGRT